MKITMLGPAGVPIPAYSFTPKSGAVVIPGEQIMGYMQICLYKGSKRICLTDDINFHVEGWQSSDEGQEEFLISALGSTVSEIGQQYQKIVTFRDLIDQYMSTVFDDEPVILEITYYDGTTKQYAAIERMQITQRPPILQQSLVQGAVVDGYAHDTAWTGIGLILYRQNWLEEVPGTDSAVPQKWFDSNGYGYDSTDGLAPIGMRSGNLHNSQITHVFRYDDGTSSFSSNLMDEAGAYDLFDSSVQVDDFLYIGIEGPQGGETMSNLEFNITQAIGTGLTIRQESYVDTFGWNWLGSSADFMSTGTPVGSNGWQDVFTETGRQYWAQVNGEAPYFEYVSTTINGVNGLWMRFRVTAVSGVGTAVQATGPIFQYVSNYVDIPALYSEMATRKTVLNLWLEAVSHELRRIVAGVRQISRGEDFNPSINLSGYQNHPNIQVTVSNNTFVDSTLKSDYGGGAARVEFDTTIAMVERVRVNFTGDLINQYKGDYRAFLRIPTAPTGYDEIAIQLEVKVGATSLITDTVYIATVLNTFLDLGLISIPATFNTASDDVINELSIAIYVSRETTSTNDLFLWRLDLVPADEGIVDIQDGSYNFFSSIKPGYYVYTDNKVPKVGSRAIILADNLMRGTYLVVGDELVIERNKDIRLFIVYTDIDNNGETWSEQDTPRSFIKVRTRSYNEFEAIKW
jgi:hypothetical protein